MAACLYLGRSLVLSHETSWCVDCSLAWQQKFSAIQHRWTCTYSGRMHFCDANSSTRAVHLPVGRDLAHTPAPLPAVAECMPAQRYGLPFVPRLHLRAHLACTCTITSCSLTGNTHCQQPTFIALQYCKPKMFRTPCSPCPAVIWCIYQHIHCLYALQ